MLKECKNIYKFDMIIIFFTPQNRKAKNLNVGLKSFPDSSKIVPAKRNSPATVKIQLE